MTDPAFIILDTETGGLDPRVSPLMSIAILVCGGPPVFTEIDGFQIKIRPPDNSWLEIPTPSTMGLHNKRKSIDHYLNVNTRETSSTLPEGAQLITAYAAEVNKYIHLEGHSWDLSAIAEWHNQSFAGTVAEVNLRQYVTQVFQGKRPMVAAHNAQFDQRYVDAHMPLFAADLYPTWFCTLAMSREFWKKRGEKHSSTLLEMAKVAGYDYGAKAHDAFEDVKATLAVMRYLKNAE